MQFVWSGVRLTLTPLVVGVVNTLRARGHWFDSFIGDAPLISTVEARSPICRDVGIQSSTINLRNEVKLFFSPLCPSWSKVRSSMLYIRFNKLLCSNTHHFSFPFFQGGDLRSLVRQSTHGFESHRWHHFFSSIRERFSG